MLFHLTPSHRALSQCIDGAICTNPDLEAHNHSRSHTDLKYLEKTFFSREATQGFTPESVNRAEQVLESQENPRSKVNMTILFTSHSQGTNPKSPLLVTTAQWLTSD